jgi:predicted RNA-binding protein with PUA-like domain
MLNKHPSLTVAEKVLRAVNKIMPQNISGTVLCYQNGREHGFQITYFNSHNVPTLLTKGGPLAYYICENRNSDNIVVAKGSSAMQSISDDAYANRKYFDPGNYEEAAEWIVNDIQAELNKKEQEESVRYDNEKEPVWLA